MERKIRFGLIGYGKVAALHAHALSASTHGELVAVYGRDYARCQAFAAQWHIHACASLADMASREGVEAVIVTTPHPRHHADAIAALEAGLHVLVEKPMALTTAQAEDMIATAARRGRMLSVIAQRRWYPSCRRIHAAIQGGKLGNPMLGQVTILGWRDEDYYRSDPWRGTWEGEGGGVIVNQAPHQFDLLCWYLGEVKEVFGHWTNVNHPYIEVDDSALAVVRFHSGALASIFVSNSQKPGIYAKVHIHGSSGASAGVQTDGGAMFIAGRSGVLEPPYNDIWTIPGEESETERWRQEDARLFKEIEPTWYFFSLQEDDFAQAILQHRPPAVPPDAGLQVARIMEGIYRSQKEGRPILFD
ncbi:MAG: Gfo/Idh/MocA family oxidoreductase [Rectinema sp.]|nr:Gfo/Idh/MocA family oxidoreductase [Rectinema sp.]